MEWFLIAVFLFVAYKLDGIYRVSVEIRDCLERAGEDPYTLGDAMRDGIA